MHTNDPTHKLTWRGNQNDMELIADLMADALEPPAEAVSLRKAVIDGELHPEDWVAEAYFPDKPDMEAITSLFSHTLPARRTGQRRLRKNCPMMIGSNLRLAPSAPLKQAGFFSMANMIAMMCPKIATSSPSR